MVVSDIVLTRALPEAVRKSVEAYVGCVAGAALKADYLRLVGESGFEDVEVVEEKSYGVGTELLPEAVTEAGTWDAVRSVKVRARKPKK